MQTTAQLWLVYKLTNSAALLGVYGFANQIPILALAWAGGYVGDRYNRHIGVIWTQTLSMILAFVLAALTLMHLIQVWHLIFIAFLVGIVNAFDVPIRQAFLVQMVGGKEDLPSAIALNSSIFNGARVLGPAIGAAALAWLHEGWCFFLNGVSFLAVLATHRIAIPEFYERLSFCHERFSDAVSFAAAEFDEFVGIAIFGVFAGICEGCSASRRGGIWIAAEYRGGGRGAGRGAVRVAHRIQRFGTVDGDDGGDLLDVPADFLAVARHVALRCRDFCGRVRGYVADGGGQYHGAESGSGRIARASDGRVRDHVHGRAAAWIASRGRSSEAHRRAADVDGV